MDKFKVGDILVSKNNYIIRIIEQYDDIQYKFIVVEHKYRSNIGYKNVKDIDWFNNYFTHHKVYNTPLWKTLKGEHNGNS